MSDRFKPITFKDLIKVFKYYGWKEDRQKGSHIVLVKDDMLRPLVIPKYKEIPVFIIKSNLETAKLTNEEYFEALKNI